MSKDKQKMCEQCCRFFDMYLMLCVYNRLLEINEYHCKECTSKEQYHD